MELERSLDEGTVAVASRITLGVEGAVHDGALLPTVRSAISPMAFASVSMPWVLVAVHGVVALTARERS